MRLCGLCMRLHKGYTDKEKRKMKTCDSHVNEEVKFVTSGTQLQINWRMEKTVKSINNICFKKNLTGLCKISLGT